jgi:glycosyltransferase involved in cell wall biosynthesis
MGNDPLISVVIPLFNQEFFVREAIRSALDQTYKNIEVIVVDDGSTDQSAAAVKAINDPRIRYYYQANSGLPAAARNQGIRLAKGEWVAFLDHDDVWLPNKLAMQMNALGRDPGIKLISGNMTFLDDRTPRPIMRYRQRSLNNLTDLIVQNRVMTTTALANKAVLDELGGFRENRDLMAVEDYDLWLRIAQKYKILYLDEVLAKYRIPANRTSGGRLKELARLENFINKYLPALVSTPAERTAYATARQRLHFWYALAYLKDNDPRYKDHLKQAGLVSPSVFAKLIIGAAWLCPAPVARGAFGLWKSFFGRKKVVSA